MSSVGHSGIDGAVESFFGDLVDEVALCAPVSRTSLVVGLAAVERAVEPEDGVSSEREVPTVLTLSVEEWSRVANDTGMRPAVALSVREVHRRMASALGAGDACSTPGADPFVVIDT